MKTITGRVAFVRLQISEPEGKWWVVGVEIEGRAGVFEGGGPTLQAAFESALIQ